MYTSGGGTYGPVEGVKFCEAIRVHVTLTPKRALCYNPN